MGSVGTTQEVDVLVVGAGFGGCYLLNILRKNGFKTKVVEAGTTVGGVWCWNRYPGARVDCEMPYYGYSDPAIWNTYRWTERYPSDTAMRSYFRHVADVWDLDKDIELQARVTNAKYEGGKWIVKTAKGGTYVCKWFIAATGTSFKPHIPEWPGMEKYEGFVQHSALWPEEPVDMTGKRIAVIGAGSSGVQIMQEAPKVASSVTHFIKTPNLAVPMCQRNVTEDEIYSQKTIYPHVFKACRESRTGLPITNTGKKVFDVDENERKQIWEERWKRGGFSFPQAGFTDYILNEEANRATYDFWAEKTRARIKDPQKRDLLAPLEPPYFISTKRPSLEQDYYESCDLPNVEVTNSPIAEFSESGIRTEDGNERKFDIIAVCTGFDAVTGGLKTMGIKGRDGLDLEEKWNDGILTNLGMIVNGFPNFFIVYGPQAPTSLTNGPPFIELQVEWILSALRKQREENLATVESKQEAEQAWREHCLGIADRTLLVKTNSWYMGANVPGKKREILLYLGGIPMWYQACLDALDGWKGFEVHAKADS